MAMSWVPVRKDHHGLDDEIYSDAKVSKVFLRMKVQALLVVDLLYLFPLVRVTCYSGIVW